MYLLKIWWCFEQLLDYSDNWSTVSKFLTKEAVTQISSLKSKLTTNLSQTNINVMLQDHPGATVKLQNQHQPKC